MNEDKIIQKLTDHDARFDLLLGSIKEVEKDVQGVADDLTKFKDQSATTQDKILTILDRLDQERAFTSNWIDRIEREIAKIKQVLKIQ